MMSKVLLVARILVWIVLSAITLELCARTEDKVRYGASFFGNYSMDSLYRYDELGKYGRPNSSYLKWHLNDAGYRGPSLRRGTFRIACIGSSETFGLYETAENEWPRQLERILNRRSDTLTYEVVDTAYPGLAIGTSLRRLPQMLTAVSPQLVVIYPSYTSYIESDQPQPWPLATTAHPKLRPETRHFEWRIAARVEVFAKGAVPEGWQNWVRGLQVRQAAKETQAMPRLPERNVAAFASDLDRLVSELQARGVHVVLATHSSRFGVSGLAKEDAPVLTAWRKFYPTLEEQGLLDMESRMSTEVRKIGVARGVPMVDAARTIAPGRENFAEFVHFTDAGARSLATMVADEIDREAAAGTIAAPTAR